MTNMTDITDTLFTQGEWLLNYNQIVALHTDEEGEHETLIADVFDEHDWWRANAALLRAAPTLFKALSNLYEKCRAEAAEAGLTNKEMTWLHEAKSALALAKSRR